MSAKRSLPLFFSVGIPSMYFGISIIVDLLVLRRKEKLSVMTYPLIKHLLSTAIVCCRLLPDIFLNINKVIKTI